MGPIVVNIDPVAVHIGAFAIRWYGIAIATGILAGFYLGGKEAKRRGLNVDEIYSVSIWAVVGGIVGARLLHVIDKLDYYLANPTAILTFQDGGLAILGGIIGGTVTGILYARRRHLPVGKVTDALAPGVILGQAIGRIGCTINGDAVGVATDVPWGFVYTNPGAMAPSLGQAYQPTMIYEIIWDLMIFGFLWRARDRMQVDGLLFLSYLALYSVGKFAISFWRQEAIFMFGLQEAQVVSLATVVFAATMAFTLVSRARTARRMA